MGYCWPKTDSTFTDAFKQMKHQITQFILFAMNFLMNIIKFVEYDKVVNIENNK